VLTRTAIPRLTGEATRQYCQVVDAHDPGLIGPDETAYRLELTAAELKVTYTALKALLNDFGHDEYDVQRIVRSVLTKLPPAESIESIDLKLPRGRPRL
jgi:hypothetical protein